MVTDSVYTHIYMCTCMYTHVLQCVWQLSVIYIILYIHISQIYIFSRVIDTCSWILARYHVTEVLNLVAVFGHPVHVNVTPHHSFRIPLIFISHITMGRPYYIILEHEHSIFPKLSIRSFTHLMFMIVVTKGTRSKQ